MMDVGKDLKVGDLLFGAPNIHWKVKAIDHTKQEVEVYVPPHFNQTVFWKFAPLQQRINQCGLTVMTAPQFNLFPTLPNVPIFLKSKDIAQKECDHDLIGYSGLTETYKFCTKCDAKFYDK